MCLLLFRAAGFTKYYLFRPFCKNRVNLRSLFGRVLRFAFLAYRFVLLFFCFFGVAGWSSFLGF